VRHALYDTATQQSPADPHDELVEALDAMTLGGRTVFDTSWRQRSLARAVAGSVAVLALVSASCGGDDDDGSDATTATAEGGTPADTQTAGTAVAETATPTDDGAGVTSGAAPSGESLDADLALLEQALGTSSPDGVPDVVLASIARAGTEVTPDMLTTALKCWKEQQCDTGTGGDVTVALADGFGENVWREVTYMEFVLQALTYPEIGEIIYTSAQGDTDKAISDFRSLIARDVDVIVGFADAGEALLPSVREATAQGITVVPYISGPGGTAGEDYLAVVGEDLCQLGENFAAVLNEEVGTGKIAFLGGTPGNPLSAAWQACEEPALGDGLELVGTADTNWTREGTLQAVSGLLSEHPDLAGISYEYADGFLGGVRAYEAANAELDLVLTLRTDEIGLFCEWVSIGNPDFKIYFSSGGGFDSRIALTAGMMARTGEEVPPNIIVPAKMRQVDESSCNPDIPGEAPASSLVPPDVLAAMYPA
jgi:ABC-type sugar transport system substrate-binding protein